MSWISAQLYTKRYIIRLDGASPTGICLPDGTERENSGVAREGDGLMAKDLAGKVALVTGGSRGIGAAIARRLAAEGAAVAITYASAKQKADEVVKAIQGGGGRAVAIAADNADALAVRNAVDETARVLGRIDVLVASAGIA